MRTQRQSGFSIVEALIVLAVLGLLVLVGLQVAGRVTQPATKQTATTQQPNTKEPNRAEPIVWNYDDQAGKWTASGTPPQCPAPIFDRSPVDVSKATGVLYPGQYRTRNYKPHGGFAFDKSQATDIQVVMPADAELNGLVRYIESGEIQYKVSFITGCGIAFYFDHLYALAPAFQAIAETTPEPLVDDTRSVPFAKPYPFKAGDVIATASGHPATHNIAFDFGVLDYRQPNEISRDAQWAALHQTFKSSEWYGVCWFDLLPAADAARAKALPSRDQKSGVRSDYCTNPLGNTLGVNGGQPV